MEESCRQARQLRALELEANQPSGKWPAGEAACNALNRKFSIGNFVFPGRLTSPTREESYG